MENTFQSLFDFVNIAERNRKISPDTATGYRVSLKLFEKELNEDEKAALSVFQERLDAIYATVVNKNKAHLSIATLLRYYSRVKKVLKDYEMYGIDPSRMASWNSLASTRKKIPKDKSLLNISSHVEGEIVKNEDITPSISREVSINRFEIVLRPNIKAIILTPSDLTANEARKIKGYIEYLETTVSE